MTLGQKAVMNLRHRSSVFHDKFSIVVANTYARRAFADYEG
ncbi:hypothetical protein [Chroococcidiopsis sp. CCALA 051]|nr:hypothetical protein [Chroococcidiopsis sp. CCALA 051]